MHRVLRRIRNCPHAWLSIVSVSQSKGALQRAAIVKYNGLQWAPVLPTAQKKPARISGRLDAISPNSGRIALYCALSRSGSGSVC